MSLCILLGTSEVTTADGTVLTQNEVKDEILDYAEDLKEEALTENNFFEDVVTDETIVTDGEELLDAAEDLLDDGKLPENNIEGSVDHFHNPDGSTTTLINKEEVSQAAPAAEPAAETAAESVDELSDEEAAEDTDEERKDKTEEGLAGETAAEESLKK